MKKIISVILAVLCICSAFAVVSFADDGGVYDSFLPVNEDPAWAAKAIDGNGQMRIPDFYESYSGVYFCCQKTAKFYVADEEVCPHCGQKAYHYGKNNEMKTFQNSDLFRLKFAICCNSCGKCVLGNFNTVFESQSATYDPEGRSGETAEIAKKYKYLWTKGYDQNTHNANCPNCGEAALDSKWEIQWIYNDECHYIDFNFYPLDRECLNPGGPQATQWKEQTFDFSKDPDNQGENPIVELNFWQKIILWFKNLFAAIAGLFS